MAERDWIGNARLYDDMMYNIVIPLCIALHETGAASETISLVVHHTQLCEPVFHTVHFVRYSLSSLLALVHIEGFPESRNVLTHDH